MNCPSIHSLQVSLVLCALVMGPRVGAQTFIRGEANGDGLVNVTDISALGRYLIGDTSALPVDCAATFDPDVADVNDNEHFTIADILNLGEFIACGAFKPPPAVCDVDPDGDTKGFDRIDPTYRAFLAIELIGARAEVLLQISPRLGTDTKAATLVVDFNGTLISPALDSTGEIDFEEAPGIDTVLAIRDSSRIIVTVQSAAGGCGGMLPAPDPVTGRIDLGKLIFANIAGADCPMITGTTNLAPQHTMTTGNALTHRATIVTPDFADHHPNLATPSCAAPFVRGEVNGDANLDVSDVVWLGQYLAGDPALPLDCSGVVAPDAADVNDNEYFTFADILLLSAHLANGAPKPPPDVCGPDIDDDTNGFGSVDPSYNAFLSAEIATSEVGLVLEVDAPGGATLLSAALVVEFDPGVLTPVLAMGDPDFAPASGVDTVLARLDGNHVVIVVQGDRDTSSPLPAPNPLTGRVELGRLPFTSVPGASCPMVTAAASLKAEHALTTGNNIDYRATIVTEDFADHHPALAAISCLPVFSRGDANGDGQINISDVVSLGAYYGDIGDPPVDCGGQVNLDTGDMNDNEHFTIADILNLAEFLTFGATMPPPDNCGSDPDNSTRGFDVVDPAFNAFVTAEITSTEVLMRLQIAAPPATPTKAANLILEFDPTVLDPVRDVNGDLCFSRNPGVGGSFLRQDGNRIIITTQGQVSTGPLSGPVLPSPNPSTNRIDLGFLSFQNTAAADCAAIMSGTSLVAEHTLTTNGLNYRSTIVTEDFADHHPMPSSLACAAGTEFVRGDANLDGDIDISDPIAILGALFGTDSQLCRDANDGNDDGDVDISDPPYILDHLFRGGLPIPPPNACGSDPTADCLDCGMTLCP